jgi:hypothetical protein
VYGLGSKEFFEEADVELGSAGGMALWEGREGRRGG